MKKQKYSTLGWLIILLAIALLIALTVLFSMIPELFKDGNIFVSGRLAIITMINLFLYKLLSIAFNEYINNDQQ